MRMCLKDLSKRNIVLVLAIALLLCAALPASPSGRLAPLDPAFVSFVSRGRAAGEGMSEFFGEIPSPIDWTFARGARSNVSFFDELARERGLDFSSADPLPASFDLRARSGVTPVLEQRGWGTCWAFAAIEAIESSVLVGTKEVTDLSELHLAWFAYVDESPSKPAFTQHTQPEENSVFDNGGSAETALSILTRGTGPVDEADAPYPDMPTDTEENKKVWAAFIPDPLPSAASPARFRVTGGLQFFEPTDIKRALMTIGGLRVSMNGDKMFRDDATGVFYCSDKTKGTNHAVMLVGWDDAYPRENFASIDKTLPSADGAWLIQNSWGTEAGDQGYYWLSYGDTVFPGASGAVGFLTEAADAYSGIHDHNPLGRCNNLPLLVSQLDMANVFTAERNERIVSVSFYTGNTNVDYEIQVYGGLTGDEPNSGVPLLEVPQRGSAGPMGYRAVSLDRPVSVSAGERFAVSVRLIETTETMPPGVLNVAAETPIVGYSDKAVVSRGESFLREGDGEWEDTFVLDATPFNLCVKAFTVAENRSGGGVGCSGAYGVSLFAAAVVFVLRRRR